MALRERLIGNNLPGGGSDGTGQHSFQEMKSRLHRTLINRMDLTKLSSLSPEQVHAEVSRLAESVLAQEAMPLSVSERERLFVLNVVDQSCPNGNDWSTTFSTNSSDLDHSSRCLRIRR